MKKINLNDHISFDFLDVKEFPFPDVKLREWIFSIIKKEKKRPGSINYIFCSDDELHRMNVQFLEHDTLTDVITFDYSADFGDISGDIFISVDRIKDNSELFNTSFLHELGRVLAHGVLHICGYGDKTEEEEKLMRDKENHYLQMADFL